MYPSQVLFKKVLTEYIVLVNSVFQDYTVSIDSFKH